MRRIEAHEVPLHEVFSSDFSFRIPDYQRPYAWEREQAVQLLEDLLDTVGRDEDEPYFLGSVVLVKESEDAAAEVIDGQQRLTTLIILFAVLRDLAEAGQLKGEIDLRIREPGSLLLGLEPEPRLRLRQRDQAFFEQRVQTPGATEEIANLDPATLSTDAQAFIRDNCIALRERLADRSSDQRLALVQMLATRTYLVVVSTPDLPSAHRIFSVMNARGLDLSAADIFKSLVVGRIGETNETGAAMYADRWEDAEEQLSRDGFGDLFLHVRMIFAKERARKELLKEFEEQVLSRYLPDTPTAFVDDVLVPYANAYRRLRDCDYVAGHGAQDVNAWLRRLHQIDNNDWRPPALWALHHRGGDPEWLGGFLRALERIAASMLIRRVYATPRATRYAAILRALENDEGLESESLELTSADRAATVSLLRGELYHVAPVRKYVLLRLDELLANNPGVSYDHKIITIEHVLPQTPAEGSHWLADFSDEERAHWTHRLANLVLLNRSRNSAAQNYGFDHKKRHYFTSGDGVAAFALTTQVVAAPSWTPAVLELRQESLIGALTAEWAL
jgi:hypothetical protein